MKVRKLILRGRILFLQFLIIPMQLNAILKAIGSLTPPAKAIVIRKINPLILRLKNIKEMDISALSTLDSNQLHDEMLLIKHNLKGIDNKEFKLQNS